MLERLRPFDLLILVYLAATGLLALGGALVSSQYLLLAAAHVMAMTCVACLVWYHNRSGRLAFLRWCYPILLISFVHYEIELLGHVIHGGRFFDEVVAAWDAMLFGSHPHLWLQDVFVGAAWSGLMHFFYLTFYPILIGGFVYTWFRRRERMDEFAFVFMGMFCSFMIMFILFPVTGPLTDRALHFEEAGLLASAVDFLFEQGDSDGGAFPSSHVGQSIGVLLLLRPMKWYVLAGLIVTIAGLSVATTYTMVHYAVDAVAGVPAGFALFLLWMAIYQRIRTGEKSEAVQA